MNDEQQNPQGENVDDAQLNTNDVREAIERAKETMIAEEESAVVENETFTLTESQEDAEEPRPEIAEVTEMPSVNEVPPIEEQSDPEAVSIPADHPMAPLYVQQPMPPNMKANRLAGVLISLLATLAYAIIYAGAIAATRAPYFPPSRFLQEGLYPYLTSLGFVLPLIVFFVTMMILVLIFNRAGWWVYSVLGVFVGLLVWLAAGTGYALSPQLFDAFAFVSETGKRFDLHRILGFSLTLPSFLAAVIGREVTIWFGAWIGKRGAKIKQRNADAIREHEEKLAEVQARIS